MYTNPIWGTFFLGEVKNPGLDVIMAGTPSSHNGVDQISTTFFIWSSNHIPGLLYQRLG